MTREYLGEVILTSGDKVKVFIPTIADIISANIEIGSVEGVYQLCALSVDMTSIQFQQLSLIDGNNVASKLNEGIVALQKLGRKQPHE